MLLRDPQGRFSSLSKNRFGIKIGKRDSPGIFQCYGGDVIALRYKRIILTNYFT